MLRTLSFERKSVVIIATALLAAVAFGFTAEAQERSYEYERIEFDINVERDASITVKELQTFSFDGEYHQAVRSIPHNQIGIITDVAVQDTESGEYLDYSFRSLDKNDPLSWGKYTVYEHEGYTYIEWYYDLGDYFFNRLHTWTIHYTVHGAITFYPDHDELYWNLFSEYDVPVLEVEALVHLPEETTAPQQTLYVLSDREGSAENLDARTFRFATSNLGPREPVTIAAGWQKGIVSKQEYWRDWFGLHLAYVLSVLIVVSSIIYGFLYWFFTERYHKGRGTIVPEYDPPRKLRPAMGQLIATERTNGATWPATIVDLAVRGYVKVVKERKGRVTGIGLLDQLLGSEGYCVLKVREYANDAGLEEYEKQFLDILFDGADEFSTIELQKKITKSPSFAQQFQKKMDELKKTLYAETSDDTKVYEVPLTVRNWQHSRLYRQGFFFFVKLIIPLFVFAIFALGIVYTLRAGAVLAGTIFVCSVFLYIFIKYNPRLNEEGFILRDEWRGFKLYLKTAEKYRMQNLTPDMFEKYLPYAMIFGIEKQWAQAFEAMHLREPGWYGTSGYTAGAFSSGDLSGGAFSPALFSTSFSSSFTSAFASSGASGAASGGGGAGGGGGGGGGGAS